MENLFNRLFKYKPSDTASPAENFITESLVHILEFSLQHKTSFLHHFFDMLGKKIEVSDYQNVFIDTQRQFETTYNLYAIPDICIQINSDLFVFEVKYESGINIYGLPEDLDTKINQIKKYQGIVTSPPLKLNLYTLVLHSSFIDFKTDNPDFEKEIHWHDIYITIKNYKSENEIENYLHNEIKKFMEDNKMAIPKVSYELVNGMQALLDLFKQIEIVLEKLKIPYTTSFGYNWTGFYLYKDSSKSDKYYSWIGTYWEVDRLTFLFSDQKAQDNIVKMKKEHEFERNPSSKSFCKYFFYEKEHFFCLSAQEQLDRIEDWISENYSQLSELSNS